MNDQYSKTPSSSASLVPIEEQHNTSTDNAIVVIRMESEIKWKENEDLVQEVLCYFDVANLIRKKAVCKQWKQLCTNAIDGKVLTSRKKAFESKNELCKALQTYLQQYENYNICGSENIATKYGWPIGKWDISSVER